MPVLVEVQQRLSTLPEAMETIGSGLERLATLMDRLQVSIDALDRNVEALRASLEPIGRVADRLPGNRKPAGQGRTRNPVALGKKLRNRRGFFPRAGGLGAVAPASPAAGARLGAFRTRPGRSRRIARCAR